jgi:hypothetical protein
VSCRDGLTHRLRRAIECSERDATRACQMKKNKLAIDRLNGDRDKPDRIDPPERGDPRYGAVMVPGRNAGSKRL